MSDLTHISDDLFDSEELVQAERTLLKAIDFDIIQITSYDWLRNFYSEIDLQNEVIHSAEYFLHLAMCNYRFLQYTPEAIAASSLFLAVKLE